MSTSALSITTVRFNKDPGSWLTHFVGLVAAVAGLALLLARTPAGALEQATSWAYGCSLMAVFGASSAYHFFDLGPRGNRWLRHGDHIAIFFLIAATFLPPVTRLLDGSWRTATLVGLGGMITVGVAFELLWRDPPRWLQTALYVAMGWSVLIPGIKMFPQFDDVALGWLFGGAAAYSLGAVIYARKRPNPWPGVFGFHEIWHLFVLAGAACHFAMALHFCGDACLP